MMQVLEKYYANPYYGNCINLEERKMKYDFLGMLGGNFSVPRNLKRVVEYFRE